MVATLAGLFLAAFLSATLLPGSSEAALIAILVTKTAPVWPAIFIATLGNTLGALANWGIGLYGASWRDHPRFPVKPAEFERYRALYARYGIWSLLLSWVPVIGDPLTVMAGVAGTPLRVFLPLVAIGKFARYLVVAGIVSLI